MKVRWLIPVLALVSSLLVLLAVSSPPITARASPGQSLVVNFSASDVWTPSPTGLAAFEACQYRDFSCDEQAMAADGASADARAFFRLTGQPLASYVRGPILAHGTIVGTQDMAGVQYPPVILGGVPAVILTDIEAEHIVSGLALDPSLYPDLAPLPEATPSLDVWSPPTLESDAETPAGGERLVYDYGLVNGCHVCGPFSALQIAFDFDASGYYLGATPIGVLSQ